MVLSVLLLIVNLIVEAGQTMKHVEVDSVCGRDSRYSNRVAALDQIKTSASAIQDCADGHSCRHSGKESPETSLGLPDAEALMVVEEVGLFLDLGGTRTAQKRP